MMIRMYILEVATLLLTHCHVRIFLVAACDHCFLPFFYAPPSKVCLTLNLPTGELQKTIRTLFRLLFSKASKPSFSASLHSFYAPTPGCNHCKYLSCIGELKTGHSATDVDTEGLSREDQALFWTCLLQLATATQDVVNSCHCKGTLWISVQFLSTMTPKSSTNFLLSQSVSQLLAWKHSLFSPGLCICLC